MIFEILFQAAQILGYGIILAGLRLFIHRTGFLSLGDGAFAAVGAYTTAIIAASTGVPAAVTMPVAAAVTFVLGFLVSLPALALVAQRWLAAIYVLLASFSLTLATPYILRLPALKAWTNGAAGLVIDTRASGGFVLSLVLAIPLIAFTQGPLVNRLARPIVLSGDPQAHAPVTIGAFTVPLTFGLSACFAGIAGSLLAFTVGFISPEFFIPAASLVLLLGLLVVGIGTIWGILVGALLLELASPLSQAAFAIFGQQSERVLSVLYGALVVLCLVFMPRGLAGLWQRAGTPP